MNYKDTIKKDRIQAMKDKNIKMRTFLSTVLGEIDLVDSKSPISDTDIERILKKMRQNATDAVNKYAQDAQHEIDYLNQILPNEVSESDLTCIIANIISGNTQYDGMNSGRATGMVIKELMATGIVFNKVMVKPIIDNILV